MNANIVLSDSTPIDDFLSGFMEASVKMPPPVSNMGPIFYCAGLRHKCDMIISLLERNGEDDSFIPQDVTPSSTSVNNNGAASGNVKGMDKWDRSPLKMAKSVCPGIAVHSADDVLSYDIECESTEGIMRINDVCYATDVIEDAIRVVVADLKSYEMNMSINDDWIDLQSSFGVIDLDVSGKRWEGGVKKGKPCGYGVVYDEEGRIEYEGFMIDEMRVCYGTEFYSDVGRVKYAGCYCNNMRFGKGILYDRYGAVDYEGLWKNDEPYSAQFDGSTIDNHTESITISNHSFIESKSFILPSYLTSLKRIVIGDDCFGSVRSLVLDGLNELESIVIGENSYTFVKTSDCDIRNSERSDGTCRIMNCPKLQSIQIGDFSFCEYHSFELNHLQSLHFIDIGGRCFYCAPLFALTGLIDWLV